MLSVGVSMSWAQQSAAERGAFQRWLASTVRSSFAAVARRPALATYEASPAGAVIDALWRLAARRRSA